MSNNTATIKTRENLVSTRTITMTALLAAISYVLAFLEFPVPLSPSFARMDGQTLNVGRVMTPTLAMVVMRDAAIRVFKQEPFYSAELKFRNFQAGGERMKEKAEAEKLVAECCQAGSAIITKVELTYCLNCPASFMSGRIIF